MINLFTTTGGFKNRSQSKYGKVLLLGLLLLGGIIAKAQVWPVCGIKDHGIITRKGYTLCNESLPIGLIEGTKAIAADPKDQSKIKYAWGIRAYNYSYSPTDPIIMVSSFKPDGSDGPSLDMTSSFFTIMYVILKKEYKNLDFIRVPYIPEKPCWLSVGTHFFRGIPSWASATASFNYDEKTTQGGEISITSDTKNCGQALVKNVFYPFPSDFKITWERKSESTGNKWVPLTTPPNTTGIQLVGITETTTYRRNLTSDYCLTSTINSNQVTLVIPEKPVITASRDAIEVGQTKKLTATPAGGTFKVFSGGGTIKDNVYTPPNNITGYTFVAIDYTGPRTATCPGKVASFGFTVKPELTAKPDMGSILSTKLTAAGVTIIANVRANDISYGQQATTNNSTVEALEGFPFGNWPEKIKLDQDGRVSVKQGIVGTYRLNYKLCERPGPLRCKIGDITVTIVPVKNGRVGAEALESSGDDIASPAVAYPNPVTDEVTLKYFSEQEGSVLDVDLTDLQGMSQLRHRATTNLGLNLIKLNLRYLPSGSYVVRLVEGNKVSHTKIVKIQ